MPYTAPSGWLEPVDARNANEMAISMFHRSRTCPLIREGAELVETDRPYGARRCPECGRAE